jgi:hypothetical protein
VSGFQVFENVAKVPVGANDRPKKPCIIVNCGQVKVMSDEEIEQQKREREAAALAAKAASERAEAERRMSTLANVRCCLSFTHSLHATQLALETQRVGDAVAASLRAAVVQQPALLKQHVGARKASAFGEDDEFGSESDDSGDKQDVKQAEKK